MSKNSAIQICLRVRPNKDPYNGFKLLKQDCKAQFFVAKQQDQGYVNNQKQKRSFQFNQVFDMDTKQQKIFDKVAKDVVDSAIEGFNGTIFAYGQTGSGKTFTMTGGTQSYQDRGLIPRTLSYIFNQSRQRQQKIKVSISYLQIYGGTGYDLLQPQNLTKKLMDLPKVVPRQGSNGQLLLTNLRQHPADNQQDALNLLFIGDTNRVVSKTPKNDQSTRSHCIFIIRIQTQKPGSDVRSVATIHLVDLSGSERIKDTGVQGKLQSQAISINLGLHFLQRVIVCLNKKANGQNIHVPYRQSLMTMILKDSIGGNCKTRMIATVSAKQQDIMQSISTCKFAMRVAMIKNDLQKNQAVDPGVIIQRLKKQNAQLKAQLALLKGGDVKEQLDKYQIQDCHKMIEQFIQSDDPSSTIILTDRLKINQCFYHFKNLYKNNGVVKFNKAMNENSSMNNQSNNNNSNNNNNRQQNQQQANRSSDEVKRLKLLVQQRDNEIALLLTLINKKKGDNNEIIVPVKRQEQQNLLRSVVRDKPISFPKEEQLELSASIIQQKSNKSYNERSTKLESQRFSKLQSGTQIQQIQRMLIKPVNLNSQQMLDHAQAFQQFRRAYRKNEAMQQNQQIKQDKMIKGKQLGKIVNDIRQKINKLKNKLQQLKRQNAVNDLVQNKSQQVHPQQQQIRNQMNKLKQIYKNNFQKLKTIKLQIQNIDNLQKKNSEALQRDFLKWITFKQKQRQNMAQNIDSSLLTSGIKDQQVKKHLQSFFKAKEQIRKK